MADHVEAEERTPLVAGNWKMFKTRREAHEFATAFADLLADAGDEVDVAVCPPLTALDIVADELVSHGVGVWAQNGYAAPEGAFTGEVSMAMIADAGATGVLLGHSERRQLFGETDEALAEKVVAALNAGLEPVLCVGETAEEREAGKTTERVCRQLQAALAAIPPARLPEIVIAYEPIWAIGTGRAATPEIAQETMLGLREKLGDLFGDAAAQSTRLIYGGSVKPDNAHAYDGPDVDGCLVGSASLDPASFISIVRAFRPDEAARLRRQFL
jgi:triosephosphate isomerase